MDDDRSSFRRNTLTTDEDDAMQFLFYMKTIPTIKRIEAQYDLDKPRSNELDTPPSRNRSFSETGLVGNRFSKRSSEPATSLLMTSGQDSKVTLGSLHSRESSLTSSKGSRRSTEVMKNRIKQRHMSWGGKEEARLRAAIFVSFINRQSKPTTNSSQFHASQLQNNLREYSPHTSNDEPLPETFGS